MMLDFDVEWLTPVLVVYVLSVPSSLRPCVKGLVWQTLLLGGQQLQPTNQTQLLGLDCRSEL